MLFHSEAPAESRRRRDCRQGSRLYERQSKISAYLAASRGPPTGLARQAMRVTPTTCEPCVAAGLQGRDVPEMDSIANGRGERANRR